MSWPSCPAGFCKASGRPGKWSAVPGCSMMMASRQSLPFCPERLAHSSTFIDMYRHSQPEVDDRGHVVSVAGKALDEDGTYRIGTTRCRCSFSLCSLCSLCLSQAVRDTADVKRGVILGAATRVATTSRVCSSRAAQLRGHPLRFLENVEQLRHSLLLHYWAEKVWVRIWAFLDKDGNGRIDPEEIQALDRREMQMLLPVYTVAVQDWRW